MNYLAVGLMGHTWFISCLFFMKLRPQKWQVPVLLVMVPAAGPELWLITPGPERLVLGSMAGRSVLLTTERGGGLMNSVEEERLMYMVIVPAD